MLKPKSFYKARVIPEIENVIFNDPATIVFWSDGTKTVSKVMDGDEFDPEIGIASCVTKKFFGSRSQFKKFTYKKYDKQSNEQEDIDLNAIFRADLESLFSNIRMVREHLYE